MQLHSFDMMGLV